MARRGVKDTSTTAAAPVPAPTPAPAPAPPHHSYCYHNYYTTTTTTTTTLPPRPGYLEGGDLLSEVDQLITEVDEGRLPLALQRGLALMRRLVPQHLSR